MRKIHCAAYYIIIVQMKKKKWKKKEKETQFYFFFTLLSCCIGNTSWHMFDRLTTQWMQFLIELLFKTDFTLLLFTHAMDADAFKAQTKMGCETYERHAMARLKQISPLTSIQFRGSSAVTNLHILSKKYHNQQWDQRDRNSRFKFIADCHCCCYCLCPPPWGISKQVLILRFYKM